MLNFISKNLDKTRVGIILFLVLIGLVLYSFNLKNEETVKKTYQENTTNTDSENIKLIKEFFLKN